MIGTEMIQAVMGLSPRMLTRGLAQPLRVARRQVDSRPQPPRGLERWRAIAVELLAPEPPVLAPFAEMTALGPIESVARAMPGGVELEGAGGVVRLEPLADGLSRLRLGPPGEVLAPPRSWAVTGEVAPADDGEVRERGERVEVGSGALRWLVDRSSGRLSLAEAGGAVMVSDLELLYDEASGQRALRASVDRRAAFHGLGEQASGLDLRGRQVELWNSDPALYDRGDGPLYLGVPFVLIISGGRALGLFLDNPRRSWVELGSRSPEELSWRVAGGELRLYAMAGTPREVVGRFTALLGRTVLPPLWALGLHQSRWSYRSQRRVLEVARRMRQRRIPCDVIHIDIHYMDGYRCFTWDRRRFPEPREMIEELHQLGFRAVAIIDPGIKVDPGYQVYEEGVAEGHFVQWPDGERFVGPVWPGDCHFPDFTRPATRRWWGELYRPLLDDGLDAFWNDMNELALIAPRQQDRRAPDELRHDADGWGADHGEVHNVYGQSMARASVEGLARLRPQRRPLILSRSGWAGIQRWAIHWTGDNRSSWDHLRLSVPMVLNLGLSGVAMTGPDLGGFAGAPSPELFARFVELGALLPFCRIHSALGTPDQEPWSLGPEVERACRRALELRYRLLPALYTALWQARHQGVPVVRPLWLDHPGDERLRQVEDQFMMGDSLLVAPVVEAGATERLVQLPPGSWYDLRSGRPRRGDRAVWLEAQLEELPALARGGAVIPRWPLRQLGGPGRARVHRAPPLPGPRPAPELAVRG